MNFYFIVADIFYCLIFRNWHSQGNVKFDLVMIDRYIYGIIVSIIINPTPAAARCMIFFVALASFT